MTGSGRRATACADEREAVLDRALCALTAAVNRYRDRPGRLHAEDVTQAAGELLAALEPASVAYQVCACLYLAWAEAAAQQEERAYAAGRNSGSGQEAPAQTGRGDRSL